MPNEIQWDFGVLATGDRLTVLPTRRRRPPAHPPRRDRNGRFISAEQVLDLRRGDIVRVDSPAYTSPPGQQATGNRLIERHWGITARVVRRYSDSPVHQHYHVWKVVDLDSMDETWVHATCLTLMSRPVTELRAGDRVRLATPAFPRGDGTGFVEANAYGREGVVHRAHSSRAGSYRVLVEVGHPLDPPVAQHVHMRYLTLLEREGVRMNTEVSQRETLICANSYCNRTIESESDRVSVTDYSDGTGCSRCTETCAGCDSTYRRDDYALENVDGERRCSGCHSYCDDCGERYVDDGEGCPNYEDHELPRGVRGYGHTVPSMWLGGPLKKREDGKIDTSVFGAYYIGFELEITADYSQSAMPIYDWALANLGSREAIQCKEDGSVSGFEIVTMPMTPEFFESVNWESFMDLINANHPTGRRSNNIHTETSRHGLHVHIGRVAFERDDVATAAYSYLMAQGDHMERIGRRSATSYCEKITNPVSQTLASMHEQGTKNTRQTTKIRGKGVYSTRGAINHQNSNTIEIRAFRSTRSADELRDAVRLTYVAAEYIRALRVGRSAISPKALHWSMFAAWVATNHPEAFASIAGIETPKGGNGKAKELVGAGAPTANFDF